MPSDNSTSSTDFNKLKVISELLDTQINDEQLKLVVKLAKQEKDPYEIAKYITKLKNS